MTTDVFADATQVKSEPMIELEHVDKFFGTFQALKDINMLVGKKEVVVVIGPSGGGKSTLIRCINRLEKHDAGRVVVDGIELTDDLRKIQEIRRETGMVFQQFNLFPHLTALENVTLAPRQVRRMPKDAAEELGLKMLERVEIPEQAHKFPGQLSGGQQQRVAIARALTQRAEVILADEPIASLDPESARKVMEILADINRRDGKTVVVTLHQVDYAMRYCPRAVALKGGRIHFDGQGSAMSSQFLNDLYGADVDTSLMFSDQTRRTEITPRLALARA